MNTSTLPTLIQRFFTDRLTAQLQASPNTVAGYRDTFRLLLRFASQRRNKPPTKLRIEDPRCRAHRRLPHPCREGSP
jgi:integrase/recombinase XerD